METSEVAEVKKKKSIEDLTKDELLVVFEKLKVQTLQLSQNKRELEQQLEVCQTDKEEVRRKAQQVVLRCKELEKKIVDLEARPVGSEDIVKPSDLSASASSESEEKLAQALKEVGKYKDGFEQLAVKFRTLKTAYEAKYTELEQANNEILRLQSQIIAAPQPQLPQLDEFDKQKLEKLQLELETMRLSAESAQKVILNFQFQLLSGIAIINGYCFFYSCTTKNLNG